MKSMKPIYIEENQQYSLDCSKAVWSTDKLHSYYQDSNHTYGNLGFLCDVDFIIETDTNILLVEYKNANVPGAAHPEAFEPSKNNKLENVANKFYDSLHWLYLVGKDKPRKYIYVLEYPLGNSSSRLMVRNKLQERLPFKLQSACANLGRKLIDEVRVVDIEEWNNDKELGAYPFNPVTANMI